MTQPIQSSSAAGYTPYDPSNDMSRADGTGGAPATSTTTNQGAEGAASSTKSPGKTEDLECLPELLNTGATCASAYLTRNALDRIKCAAQATQLYRCLTRTGGDK